ncbi:hypothetical protein XENORESO_020266 [Xenotaenia resolanae]|uniref:Uncharacterized protein n=1 Tax=Xenotaenia resolanae TaxID=208358 RepID=A0ABV0WN07_9TELE
MLIYCCQLLQHINNTNIFTHVTLLSLPNEVPSIPQTPGQTQVYPGPGQTVLILRHNSTRDNSGNILPGLRSRGNAVLLSRPKSSLQIKMYNNNINLDFIDLTMKKLSSAFNPSLREKWVAPGEHSGAKGLAQGPRVAGCGIRTRVLVTLGPVTTVSITLGSYVICWCWSTAC